MSGDLLDPNFDAEAWLEETKKRLAHCSPEMNRLAEQAVIAQREWKERYAAASPEERKRMDDEVIEAGVRFIMDERFGGP